MSILYVHAQLNLILDENITSVKQWIKNIYTERKGIMKTVEEFIKEIENSEALRNEMKAIKDNDALTAFLKNHGCGDASVKEYMDYVTSMSEGEISDNDAKAAAGGYTSYIAPEAPEQHFRL